MTIRLGNDTREKGQYVMATRKLVLKLAAAAAAAVAVVAYSITPAAAGAAPGAATQSSLVHQLDTCLPAGHAKPTVVLVHGAWADASSWSGEVATLQAAGYDVRAIANPLQDLTTDAQYVADYLKTIPGPVVLVGHSYGGAVITNAAAGLANVKALVYVDASAPAPGETNGQLSGAASILTKDTPAQLFFTTSYPGAPAGASELYFNENIFIHNFASDLPSGEAERLWASQRGIQHPVEVRGVEDHSVVVLHQHQRPDHHGRLRTRDGPPGPLTRHAVPRRVAPDADLA